MPVGSLAEPSLKKEARHTAAIAALPEVLQQISRPGSFSGWQPKAIQTQGAISNEQIRKEWVQGIYNWLCYQQNSLTGLVESFDASKDPYLKDQAATYDQALAGMAFLLMGDTKRAQKILDFYQSKWEGKGFYNFYSTLNGRVGLEWRRHVGPNMWLAMLAYQYTHITKDKTYLSLAEGLCDWVISLPHYNGGVAMSDVDEPNIPWREIVSSENVIDVVATLQMALEFVDDYRKEVFYRKELEENQKFLKEIAVQPSGVVMRGYRPFIDGLDKVAALDTTTWLIGTYLPENIFSEFGVSTDKMLAAAEKTFGINLRQGRGYDYTSKEEADKAKRDRICSLEWSAEMAQVYWLILSSSSNIFVLKEEYQEKLTQVLRGIDSFMQQADGRISYPYASVSFQKTFSDGWFTPHSTTKGTQAGSVASTCWRFFSDLWNPLRLDQPQESSDFQLQINPYQEPKLEKMKRAQYKPSALTSEGLTTAAWLNLNKGYHKKAKQLALQCIHLYSKQALEEQALKASNGGLVRAKSATEKVKQRIFSYPSLNDVAACWMILSKTEPALEEQAKSKVLRKYSLAQVWDPRGFFWSVAAAFEQ